MGVSQSESTDDLVARSRQRDEAAVVDLEHGAVEVEDRDVVLDRARVRAERAPPRRRLRDGIESFGQRTRIGAERRGQIGLGHFAPVRTSGEVDSLARSRAANSRTLSAQSRGDTSEVGGGEVNDVRFVSLTGAASRTPVRTSAPIQSAGG